MAALGWVLVMVGLIVSVAGSIWFLITAFKESILWGLGCLLIPFVSLIFLIAHWREAGKPFCVSLLGGLIWFVGVLLTSGVS